MAEFPSTRDTERLLTNRIAPDDLPDEAAGLARLIANMQHTAAQDPGTEHRIAAGIATEIRNTTTQQPALRTSHQLRARPTAKTAVVTLIAVLAGSTAVAAAATGSLPAPVQRTVANALSHVGLSTPHPGHDTTHSANPSEPHNTGRATGSAVPTNANANANANGPDATGAARKGLCTGATHHPNTTVHGRRDSAVAYANLQRLATTAGMTVTDFCKQLTPPAPNTSSKKNNNTTTTSTASRTHTPNEAHRAAATHVPPNPPASNPHNDTAHTQPPSPGNSSDNSRIRSTINRSVSVRFSGRGSVAILSGTPLRW